ncbi:glutathione S-transferase family protein [Devosia sp.]|uniref:glutathione S-transferase family protein n=1 Tax=Devosia sp. TaxID=1871048 RepID=UPI002FCC9275
MTKYTLISFKLCPYVQRVAIALAEKGITFDLVYVDLANKPDWFTAISPLGKVPLLKVGDGDLSAVLFESNVILEYLEDIGTGRPMHPAAPLQRAIHRAWMEFGSSLLGDIWSLEIATTADAYERAHANLSRKLSTLEEKLQAEPYFFGADFMYIDAVFAPAFRYFEVFDRYSPTLMLDQYRKVAAWQRALSQRASVAGAVVPEYHDLLEEFLRNKGAWLLSADRDLVGAQECPN